MCEPKVLIPKEMGTFSCPKRGFSFNITLYNFLSVQSPQDDKPIEDC